MTSEDGLHELEEWLGSLGLHQYTNRLVQEGFDHLKVAENLTDEEVEEVIGNCNMKTLHARVLRREIKKLQTSISNANVPGAEVARVEPTARPSLAVEAAVACPPVTVEDAVPPPPVILETAPEGISATALQERHAAEEAIKESFRQREEEAEARRAKEAADEEARWKAREEERERWLSEERKALGAAVDERGILEAQRDVRLAPEEKLNAEELISFDGTWVDQHEKTCYKVEGSRLTAGDWGTADFKVLSQETCEFNLQGETYVGHLEDSGKIRWNEDSVWIRQPQAESDSIEEIEPEEEEQCNMPAAERPPRIAEATDCGGGVAGIRATADAVPMPTVPPAMPTPATGDAVPMPTVPPMMLTVPPHREEATPSSPAARADVEPVPVSRGPARAPASDDEAPVLASSQRQTAPAVQTRSEHAAAEHRWSSTPQRQPLASGRDDAGQRLLAQRRNEELDAMNSDSDEALQTRSRNAAAGYHRSSAPQREPLAFGREDAGQRLLAQRQNEVEDAMNSDSDEDGFVLRGRGVICSQPPRGARPRGAAPSDDEPDLFPPLDNAEEEEEEDEEDEDGPTDVQAEEHDEDLLVGDAKVRFEEIRDEMKEFSKRKNQGGQQAKAYARNVLKLVGLLLRGGRYSLAEKRAESLISDPDVDPILRARATKKLIRVILQRSPDGVEAQRRLIHCVDVIGEEDEVAKAILCQAWVDVWLALDRPKKAISVAKEAWKNYLAGTIWEVRSLEKLAAAHLSEGSFFHAHLALLWLRLALQRVQDGWSDRPVKDRSSILRKMSMAQLAVNAKEEGLASIMDALRTAQEANDLKSVGKAFQELACAYLRVPKGKRMAITAAKSAKDFSLKAGDVLGCIVASHTLASAYQQDSATSLAYDQWLDALTEARRIRDHVQIRQALDMICNLLTIDDAMDLIQEEREFAVQATHDLWEFVAVQKLVALLLESQRRDDALEVATQALSAFQEAAKTKEEPDFQRHLAAATLLLGDVHLEGKSYEEALDAARCARQISHDVADVKGEVEALSKIREILSEKGDEEQIHDVLKEMRACYREHEWWDQEHAVILDTAELLRAQGGQAMKMLLEAEEQTPDPEQKAYAKLVRADFMLEPTQGGKVDTSGAVKLAQEARRLYCDVGQDALIEYCEADPKTDETDELPQLRNCNGEARALQMQAEVYFLKYQRFMERWRGSGDTRASLLRANALCSHSTTASEKEKAIRAISEACEMCREDGDLESLKNALCCASSMYMTLCDVDEEDLATSEHLLEAVNISMELADIAAELNNESLQAVYLSQAAELNVLREDGHSALPFALEAKRLYASIQEAAKEKEVDEVIKRAQELMNNPPKRAVVSARAQAKSKKQAAPRMGKFSADAEVLSQEVQRSEVQRSEQLERYGSLAEEQAPRRLEGQAPRRPGAPPSRREVEEPSGNDEKVTLEAIVMKRWPSAKEQAKALQKFEQCDIRTAGDLYSILSLPNGVDILKKRMKERDLLVFTTDTCTKLRQALEPHFGPGGRFRKARRARPCAACGADTEGLVVGED